MVVFNQTFYHSCHKRSHKMLQKSIIIYLAHILLTEGIQAQSPGTGMNTGDLQINNPTTDSLVGNLVTPITNSIIPAQAIGNTDHMGLSNGMTNGPTILEPISTSLANQFTDDLMRSTRETLIGGFGNHISSTDGLTGSPVSAGHFTGGLTSMPDGITLGPVIGVPLSGNLGGPINAMGIISQLDQKFTATGPISEIVGLPINHEPACGMTGTSADNLFSTAAATNMATQPIVRTAIASNTINAMNIANGPITTATLESGVSNTFANPIPIGLTGINVLNPSLPYPTVENGQPTQSLFTNTLPATFAGMNLDASKRILASLTGIDPANLGAKARFKVKSSSPISPTGLAIHADNLLMEGKLAVTGKLPFLGAVTVDGVIPDGGKGTVAYECSNGNIGIMNEVPTSIMTGPISHNFGINTVVPNALTNVATNRLAF